MVGAIYRIHNIVCVVIEGAAGSRDCVCYSSYPSVAAIVGYYTSPFALLRD